MPISNFDFKLIDRFLGYNSARDKTSLDPRYLIRGSKNVFRKESGTMSIRPGLKRRGSADSTSAGVKSAFVWENSAGNTRHVRVANSIFQVESDIVTSGTYVWYNLQSSLTSTRYVFDAWWDDVDKKDVLLFVRGDSNLFRWEGGIGKIASTTATTVVLNATVASLGFDTTSGTVLINGTSYTYSGTSGSTLTGVSGDPTGEAVDSVVLSAVTTSASTPNATFENDFLKIINNQVYIGSYGSRAMYISEDDDYLDYTVPSPRAPGDPEFLVFDSLLRGIGVKGGQAHISAGDSDWYSVEFKQITVSTTLTEQTIVSRVNAAGQEAAMGHEYITNYGDNIVYLSRGKQLKILGEFTNLEGKNFATLSLPIKTELKNETFVPVQADTSDGEVKAIKGRIYINAVTNGKTYIFETREFIDESGQLVAERFWQPPQIWGISNIVVLSGEEHGHSIANPQVYQLWDTDQYFDDNPSDDIMPYDAVMRMAYRHSEKRNELLNFDLMYLEGYMSPGTELKARVYYNYQGSSSLQEVIINDPEANKSAKFYTGFMAPGIGDSSLGDNPLGEGLTDNEILQEQLPKFRKMAGVPQIDCFEYALQVYSEIADSQWEILLLGANAVQSKREPVFLRT